jgi:hypothetical protein
MSVLSRSLSNICTAESTVACLSIFITGLITSTKKLSLVMSNMLGPFLVSGSNIGSMVPAGCLLNLNSKPSFCLALVVVSTGGTHKIII